MTSSAREIRGGPTKLFFVSMLTKDISLMDAILDLVDNSIDGAMRSIGANMTDVNSLKGYHCKLTINSTVFEVVDNCGGIPDELLDTAFQLGRPRLEADRNIPTIGMYGIGMKRAIFKISESASVVSKSNTKVASVSYSRSWLNPTNDSWDLQIEEAAAADGDRGFQITSSDLRQEISIQFGKDDFINNLRYKIGEHFGYLIERGFLIEVNGDAVSPRVAKLMFNPDKKVLPYDFSATIDGVKIKVTIGFFRQLTREVELEEATESSNDTDLNQSGITVICNDRVIVASDTTALTGWGVGATPKYHPQFRAIAGVISFFSLDATLLPVATTKHDLDQSKEAFQIARNMAMEGIVSCTSFTNRWKGREQETDSLLDRHETKPARSIVLAEDSTFGSVSRAAPDARKFMPDLPKPENSSRVKRIAFSREASEIKRMADFLLGKPDAKPGDVGIAAWEDALVKMDRK